MDVKAALQAMSAELTPIKTQIPGATEAAYYRPMTLGQSDKIQRYINAERAESDGAKLAITVILTVLDKDGAAVFEMADKAWLMDKVPQALLVDIVNEITGQAEPSALEGAEGN